MRRVLALVLVMAMVLSSGITGAFAATTVEIDSGVADSGGVGSVAVSLADTSIVAGTKTMATATITVKDSGITSTVTWSSDTPAVATVDPSSGEIAGVAAGSSVITATSTVDVTKKNTATITVTAAKSNAAAITSFKIGAVEGVIAEGDKKIAVTVPFDTAVTALKPTVEISAKAAVTPTSGTATNFTSPVAYTVTAEDGSTKNVYTVTVTVAPVVPTTVEIEVATPPTASPVTKDAALSTSNLTGGKVIETGKTDAIAGTWAWTNSSATVSATGNFKATFTPNAVANTTFNPATLKKEINVTANPVTPTPPTITSVTVSPKTASVEVKATKQLTPTVVVVGGAAQTVTWKSSDDTIATVNATGLVTAVKAGTATITATSTVDSTKKDTATITVTAKTGRKLIMYSTKSIIGSRTTQLTVYEGDYNQKDITDEIVKWVSSDVTIATVTDGNGGGLITSSEKKVGTATITATAKDGATATCEVMVLPDLNYTALHYTSFLAGAYLTSTYDADSGVSGVPSNMFWGPKSSSEALQQVLKTAESARNTNANQAKIDAATETLKTALDEFIAKLKKGTGKYNDSSANSVELAKAIIAARANHDNTKNAPIEATRAYYRAIHTAELLNGRTQTEVNKALEVLNNATAAFNARKTGGGSTGGSSSGGSSTGGGTSTPSVDRPSSNVGGSGEVKSEDIKAETSKAVADAVKAAPGATANVTVKNADNITPAALKEMAAAATKAGGKAQLMADSVVNGVVETRLYINPALAATLTAPIQLGVSTNSLEIDATKAKFASFANNIAVASFAQQGSFGMKIQAAVKLDLTQLNTKTLVFYSYDKATNTYIPIVAPAYTIDKNGYLHFSTTVGGDIIITDKALVKK